MVARSLISARTARSAHTGHFLPFTLDLTRDFHSYPHAEDWRNLFSDEAVYCPFCGHSAPARSWWTTEQVKQAQRQAKNQLVAQINQAMSEDVRRFNRSQPRKSFFKLSMKFSGQTSFVNLPAAALDEMEQKIECDSCGAHYAVIGSAFYCPCCGKNSARLTFNNTIDKVRAKIKNLGLIRDAIATHSKDEAARTCNSLMESSIPDLVVAFQRVCECVYPQIQGAKPLKRNVFQRLGDGDLLWRELFSEGYEDWISAIQFPPSIVFIDPAPGCARVRFEARIPDWP